MRELEERKEQNQLRVAELTAKINAKSKELNALNKPFNKLSPAQAERLDLLAEECAEVIVAIMKIKRHGYDTYNPDKPLATNAYTLEEELGHIIASIELLTQANDIDLDVINSSALIKKENHKLGRCYMHHQG